MLYDVWTSGYLTMIVIIKIAGVDYIFGILNDGFEMEVGYQLALFKQKFFNRSTISIKCFKDIDRCELLLIKKAVDSYEPSRSELEYFDHTTTKSLYFVPIHCLQQDVQAIIENIQICHPVVSASF